MANNTDGDAALFTPTEIVGIATVTGVIAVLTTGGNLLVILAFVTNSSLRRFSDYFILNLAVADLLIGCVCIPPYIPYLLTGVWEPGRAFCKIWLVLDYIAPAGSALNMCVISIDRYLQVAFPLRYRAKQSRNLLFVMILPPWVVAGLVYVPAIVFWEMWINKDVIPIKQCMVPYFYNMEYAVFGSMMEFTIPFVVVGTFNILIVLRLRKQTRSFAGRNRIAPIAHSSASGSMSTGNNQQMRAARAQTVSRDQKAARSLFILVLVFGVCWLPFEILALVKSVCGDCVDPVLYEVSFWILWLNSTVNPALYPLLHRRFRSAFIQLLRCSKVPTRHEGTTHTAA
ncbi:histamine H3 receptor-like [Haliotis cracherodii]|uniref:histamine H3 receptor-like n=1 Tax=Haliotis cracherodii TaxID=6455 RepID=UPI0039EA6989